MHLICTWDRRQNLITINCAAYFCGWGLFTLGFAHVMPAVISCDKHLKSTDCYLLHCAYHWSLCGCSCFSMLCAVSSFHTDEEVATPDSSLDCVCNCLYYLTLRMHSLLHSTVLQAIFAKLVISFWSTSDLNVWYHSLKHLGQQHNFCLALSFPFYLLIFPDTSKFHTAELCLLQCCAILIAGALLMFHRTVVLSSSGSDRARRDKATIICLSVSDSVLINMEEHPRRLE
jgi:hypothetical protein